MTVTTAPETQVSFRNCAPFTKCITKVDRKTINDAEDLDLVMPMYNRIEYSSNYSETTGSLWFYFKDEATNLVQMLQMILISNLLCVRLKY